MADEPSSQNRAAALAEAGAPATTRLESADARAQLRREAEERIDAFLRSVGLTDIAAITDEGGWRNFGVGSAAGRAAVVEWGEQLFLRVEAHVVNLPADRELILPLMRELLEANAAHVAPGQFGIQNGAVVVTLTQSIGAGQGYDVAACIHAVMSRADAVDELLARKYGGTALPRTAPDPAALAGEPAAQSDPRQAPAASAVDNRPGAAPAGTLFDRFRQPSDAPPPDPPATGGLFDAFKSGKG